MPSRVSVRKRLKLSEATLPPPARPQAQPVRIGGSAVATNARPKPMSDTTCERARRRPARRLA